MRRKKRVIGPFLPRRKFIQSQGDMGSTHSATGRDGAARQATIASRAMTLARQESSADAEISLANRFLQEHRDYNSKIKPKATSWNPSANQLKNAAWCC